MGGQGWISKDAGGGTVRVVRAKTAGFCPGVKRAVEMVYEQVRKNGGTKIYTYGPIIHNEEVVKDLRSKGVLVIEDEEGLDRVDEGINRGRDLPVRQEDP